MRVVNWPVNSRTKHIGDGSDSKFTFFCRSNA